MTEQEAQMEGGLRQIPDFMPPISSRLGGARSITREELRRVKGKQKESFSDILNSTKEIEWNQDPLGYMLKDFLRNTILTIKNEANFGVLLNSLPEELKIQIGLHSYPYYLTAWLHQATFEVNITPETKKADLYQKLKGSSPLALISSKILSRFDQLGFPQWYKEFAKYSYMRSPHEIISFAKKDNVPESLTLSAAYLLRNFYWDCRENWYFKREETLKENPLYENRILKPEEPLKKNPLNFFFSISKNSPSKSFVHTLWFCEKKEGNYTDLLMNAMVETSYGMRLHDTVETSYGRRLDGTDEPLPVFCIVQKANKIAFLVYNPIHNREILRRTRNEYSGKSNVWNVERFNYEYLNFYCLHPFTDKDVRFRETSCVQFSKKHTLEYFRSIGVDFFEVPASWKNLYMQYGEYRSIYDPDYQLDTSSNTSSNTDDSSYEDGWQYEEDTIISIEELTYDDNRVFAAFWDLTNNAHLPFIEYIFKTISESYPPNRRIGIEKIIRDEETYSFLCRTKYIQGIPNFDEIHSAEPRFETMEIMGNVFYPPDAGLSDKVEKSVVPYNVFSAINIREMPFYNNPDERFGNPHNIIANTSVLRE